MNMQQIVQTELYRHSRTEKYFLKKQSYIEFMYKILNGFYSSDRQLPYSKHIPLVIVYDSFLKIIINSKIC